MTNLLVGAGVAGGTLYLIVEIINRLAEAT